MQPDLVLALCISAALVAALYSSVGHAGASGYIAVMTLFGVPLATIRPAALSLNILVAAIASWQFARAGHFSWRLFWPFALPAVPAAYIGGYVTLPLAVFKVLLGITLLYSAWRFFAEPSAEREPRLPPLPLALAIGGLIGLLSGLTGTGGGIFLTPLLLLLGYARAKTAAAVSAVFILLNSAAGLAGNYASTRELPGYIGALLAAVAAGGVVGSYLGSRRITPGAIKKLLAAVLLIAGGKLLLG